MLSPTGGSAASSKESLNRDAGATKQAPSYSIARKMQSMAKPARQQSSSNLPKD
jgi:hypothetical protein